MKKTTVYNIPEVYCEKYVNYFWYICLYEIERCGSYKRYTAWLTGVIHERKTSVTPSAIKPDKCWSSWVWSNATNLLCCSTEIQYCFFIVLKCNLNWTSCQHNNKLFFMCCWPCILVIFDLNYNQMHFSLFIIFLSYSSTCFEPYCAHHQEDLLYIHSIWFFICHSSYVTVQCTGS